MFLHIEKPQQPQHVGALGIMERAVPRRRGPVPARRRPRGDRRATPPRPPVPPADHEVPFDQGRPVWVDDEHFDLAYHVRLTALPTPGTEEQLLALFERIQSHLLDRRRPLWELWFVEGLEGGRVATSRRPTTAWSTGSPASTSPPSCSTSRRSVAGSTRRRGCPSRRRRTAAHGRVASSSDRRAGRAGPVGAGLRCGPPPGGRGGASKDVARRGVLQRHPGAPHAVERPDRPAPPVAAVRCRSPTPRPSRTPLPRTPGSRPGLAQRRRARRRRHRLRRFLHAGRAVDDVELRPWCPVTMRASRRAGGGRRRGHRRPRQPGVDDERPAADVASPTRSPARRDRRRHAGAEGSAPLSAPTS